MNSGIRKISSLILVFFGVFLSFRYLLPLFLPFIIGAALAISAEPLVTFFCKRLHLPRSVAAGIGITTSFLLLALVVLLLCGLIIRELGALSGILPELEYAARSGIGALSQWLLSLSQRVPESLRSPLEQSIRNFFSGSSALLERITEYLLSLASRMLTRVPNSALGFGTGIISSFMISAKLPVLKQRLAAIPLIQKVRPMLTAIKKLKTALLGWLKAQLKLSCVTWLLVSGGLLILRVPYAILWAALIALVDAFPVLGTGIILVPWSLISFLQGSRFQAFGLLAVYAAAVLTRSALEPRLVGRQLGLDPLVTLIALYAGFRLWGIGGLILAPLLAVTAVQMAELQQRPSGPA